MTYQDGLNKIAEMAGGSSIELKKLIPDVEGMSAVLALTGEKAKGAAEDLTETTKAAGAMETAYGRMMEEADNKWSVVHNKWTREMRALGKSMKEGSSMFADFLNDLLTNDKADIIDPGAKKIVDETVSSISMLTDKEEKLTAVIKKINDLKSKRMNDILPTIDTLTKQQPGWLQRQAENLNAGIGLTGLTPGRYKQAELQLYNHELEITKKAEKELFDLYTKIANTPVTKNDGTKAKARALSDINKEIEEAKKNQDSSTSRKEYDNIQKTIDKLEAEKTAITGVVDKNKELKGEYEKLEEKIKKASEAVVNSTEKERPALQEKLSALVKQKQAWEDLIKAQRGETKGLKPLAVTAQVSTGKEPIIDQLKPMKQLTEEQKKQLEAKSKQLGQDEVAKENAQKQNELIQQTVGFLDESVSRYGELLGLSEDQQNVLQNGMNAMKGMAQIASGNVIQGAFTLIGTVAEMLIKTPEKLSEQFENIHQQIQKVIASLDIAEKSLSNLGQDSSITSLRIIKSQLLDLAEDAKSLNTELAKSSYGRRRETNMNLPASDMVKQAADLNAEIEKLSKRLLQGDISDDQRKAIEALLNSYNELLSQIDDTIQDITGTTVNDLGRSLADAFLSGEDAADAWGQKVDDIIKNIIVRQLTAQLLTKPITEAVNTLVNDSGDGLTTDEAVKFKETMDQLYAATGPAFEAVIKQLQSAGFDIGASTSSGSSAIKGISASLTEDTGSALIGQLMAVRVDIKDILKQVAMGQDDVGKNLLYLKEIAANTSYNKELVVIRDEMKDMNKILRDRL